MSATYSGKVSAGASGRGGRGRPSGGGSRGSVLCRDFLAGHCAWSDCKFSHVLPDAPEAPSEPVDPRGSSLARAFQVRLAVAGARMRADGSDSGLGPAASMGLSPTGVWLSTVICVCEPIEPGVVYNGLRYRLAAGGPIEGSSAHWVSAFCALSTGSWACLRGGRRTYPAFNNSVNRSDFVLTVDMLHAIDLLAQRAVLAEHDDGGGLIIPEGYHYGGLPICLAYAFSASVLALIFEGHSVNAYGVVADIDSPVAETGAYARGPVAGPGLLTYLAPPMSADTSYLVHARIRSQAPCCRHYHVFEGTVMLSAASLLSRDPAFKLIAEHIFKAGSPEDTAIEVPQAIVALVHHLAGWLNALANMPPSQQMPAFDLPVVQCAPAFMPLAQQLAALASPLHATQTRLCDTDQELFRFKGVVAAGASPQLTTLSDCIKGPYMAQRFTYQSSICCLPRHFFLDGHMLHGLTYGVNSVGSFGYTRAYSIRLASVTPGVRSFLKALSEPERSVSIAVASDAGAESTRTRAGISALSGSGGGAGSGAALDLLTSVDAPADVFKLDDLGSIVHAVHAFQSGQPILVCGLELPLALTSDNTSFDASSLAILRAVLPR